MVWVMGIEILADFVGILRDWEEDGFLSWCVSESAIGSTAFPGCLFSFCHPPLYYKNHGISLFFRLLAEQVTSSIQNYITLFIIL